MCRYQEALPDGTAGLCSRWPWGQHPLPPHNPGLQDWCRRSSAKLRVPGRSLPCCWVQVLPKVGASGQPPRSRRMGLGGAQHPCRWGFGKSPASHCSQETCRDMAGNRRRIWVKIGSPHTKTWHTYVECPVREDPRRSRHWWAADRGWWLTWPCRGDPQHCSRRGTTSPGSLGCCAHPRDSVADNHWGQPLTIIASIQSSHPKI